MCVSISLNKKKSEKKGKQILADDFLLCCPVPRRLCDSYYTHTHENQSVYR